MAGFVVFVWPVSDWRVSGRPALVAGSAPSFGKLPLPKRRLSLAQFFKESPLRHRRQGLCGREESRSQSDCRQESVSEKPRQAEIPHRDAILLTLPRLETSRNTNPDVFCYSEIMETATTITIAKPQDPMPSVSKVEASKGRQLYVRLTDGRSGMLDLSDWEGPLADRWETEGFDHWREDAGFACWGEDRHICPDFCSDELVEMTYEEWLASFDSVFETQPSVI